MTFDLKEGCNPSFGCHSERREES